MTVWYQLKTTEFVLQTSLDENNRTGSSLQLNLDDIYILNV